MIQIKEIGNRGSLGEGRSFGLGFTFLKKINAENYETFFPYTACRDYINDFTYIENTKKPLNIAFGFKHTLTNYFDDKKTIILSVNTLHYNSGKVWGKFQEALNILKDNANNLQRLLNALEKKYIKTIKLSKVSVVNDVLIIEFDKFWFQNAAMISLYTLIIRTYFNISENDTKRFSFKKFIKHKPFITEDAMYVQNVWKYFYNYESLKDVVYQYDTTGLPYSVHDKGIDDFLKKQSNLVKQIPKQ